MSWKATAAVFLVAKLISFSWCMTELDNQCVTDYNEDFDNDFLIGTWYFIRHFSMVSLLPTTECPTHTYVKPNATELKRYTDEYSKPNAPFSVLDNPIHEDAGDYRPRGLLVGSKQAKFFIMDPKTVYYRPPYSVRIYQRINDEFVLFNTCDSRMHWGWLISRSRNPSPEKVEAAVISCKELSYMGRREFCAVR